MDRFERCKRMREAKARKRTERHGVGAPSRLSHRPRNSNEDAQHMKQWERDAIMRFHCDPMFNAKVQFMSHAVMNCAKRFFAPNNDFQVNKENMECSTES